MEKSKEKEIDDFFNSIPETANEINKKLMPLFEFLIEKSKRKLQMYVNIRILKKVVSLSIKDLENEMKINSEMKKYATTILSGLKK